MNIVFSNDLYLYRNLKKGLQLSILMVSKKAKKPLIYNQVDNINKMFNFDFISIVNNSKLYLILISIYNLCLRSVYNSWNYLVHGFC